MRGVEVTPQERDAFNGGRQIGASMVVVTLRYVRRVAGVAAVSRVLELAGFDPADPRAEDASGWVTYSEAERVFEAAAQVTGEHDVAFKAGDEMLRQYAGSEVAALLRGLGSPTAVLENVMATASKFSTVTSMAPIELADDHAVVESRTAAPLVRSTLFCQYQAGMLSQASALFGMGAAEVVELECQTQGDARCLYRVTYSVDDGSPEHRIARLENDLAALQARFQSLQEASSELVSATSVEEVLATVTSRAGKAVRAPQFLLAVRLSADAPLRVHHEGFASDEVAREHAEAFLAGGTDHDGSLLVVDVATSLHEFGILAAAFPGAGGFLPQERQLLQAYASHAAALLEVASALDEARRKNETARTLLALASHLARVRTEQEVASAVVESLPRIVGSRFGALLLRADEQAPLRFVASIGMEPEVEAALGAIEARLGDTPLLAQLLDERRPVFLDRDGGDPFIAALFQLVGNRMAAAVPIVVQGEVVGVIGADVESGQPRLDVAERLEGLADQAASALLNVRLLEAIRAQALHDSLTGLPNARYMAERAEVAVGDASLRQTRMALLFIDLDHFKPVNDTYGHAVGDDVLRIAAERLRGQLRGTDIVARLGGDEFIVLITELGRPEDAIATAERLCRSLDDPIAVGDAVVKVSSSIGIALFPDHGAEFDALLKRADAAMYSAKADRRGTFHLAGA